LNLRSTNEAVKYLKTVLAIYIPVSFLAIAFIHGATQWEWPAWRGLAQHKNTLGQISFISILIWAFALWLPSGKKQKLSWFFLFASVVLLLGSKSSTPLLILISLLSLGCYLMVVRYLKLVNFVSYALLACVVLSLLMLRTIDLSVIAGSVGKDTTFSGRTDIWAAMLAEAETHPVLGCGFGGFWIEENPSVQSFWQDDQFPWKPNEGHQGYIDIFNETGVIGLGFLALMVISYFKNLSRLERPHFWKWLFVGILIVNFTESTLFRAASFSGWLSILSYLALYVELQRKERVTAFQRRAA
jgi:exopolysaccharide production protein ExoQ